jgi:vanillate/3-O-methylgallate O-demethylase
MFVLRHHISMRADLTFTIWITNIHCSDDPHLSVPLYLSLVIDPSCVNEMTRGERLTQVGLDRTANLSTEDLMPYKNLEEAISAATGDIVRMLRNSQIGAYVYPVVPPEFTNWRDEMRGWAETCALMDQSHHMATVFIRGKDAFRLLSHLSTNSFKNFAIGQAKQIAPCNYDGYVIGDGILFYEAENAFIFVGRNPAANWIKFQGETGGYDVSIEYDDRSPSRPMGKPVHHVLYRFQIQGPLAEKLISKLNGAAMPDIKFFNMGYISMAGRKVRALRHGMAGALGLEIWGPYAEGEEIRSTIVEAGKEFGMTQIGARAYAPAALESGWIPSPLPAVYTGAKMKPYREWLPGNGYESVASLGGSFVASRVEDYYTSPHELGYASFMRFDHDFIGKEALQAMDGKPKRKKVTFAWQNEDVARILTSIFAPPGENFKVIELPLANYASSSFDKVMSGSKLVGASMFSGYTWNERKMLSLGFVDERYAKPGTQLTLVWGEEDGGTKKTTVERHKQTEIQVTVEPVPYASRAREEHPRWRVAS